MSLKCIATYLDNEDITPSDVHLQIKNELHGAAARRAHAVGRKRHKLPYVVQFAMMRNGVVRST